MPSSTTVRVPLAPTSVPKPSTAPEVPPQSEVDAADEPKKSKKPA